MNPLIERLSADLKCGLCKELMTVPVTTKECDHSFCSACIRTHLHTRTGIQEKLCPQCRAPVLSAKLVVNKKLNGLLETMRRIVNEEEERLEAEELKRLASQPVPPIILRDWGQKGECPICHVVIRTKLLRQHADDCLEWSSVGILEDPSKRAPGKRVIPPRMRKTIHARNLKEMRNLCQSVGLPLTGDLHKLRRLYGNYIVSYNIAVDTYEANPQLSGGINTDDVVRSMYATKQSSPMTGKKRKMKTFSGIKADSDQHKKPRKQEPHTTSSSSSSSSRSDPMDLTGDIQEVKQQSSSSSSSSSSTPGRKRKVKNESKRVNPFQEMRYSVWKQYVKRKGVSESKASDTTERVRHKQMIIAKHVAINAVNLPADHIAYQAHVAKVGWSKLTSSSGPSSSSSSSSAAPGSEQSMSLASNPAPEPAPRVRAKPSFQLNKYGLLGPWRAVWSIELQCMFYFNEETKIGTFDMPQPPVEWRNES